MKQTHCFLQYGLMTFKKAGIITIFNQLTPTDLLKPYKSGYLEPTSLGLYLHKQETILLSSDLPLRARHTRGLTRALAQSFQTLT